MFDQDFLSFAFFNSMALSGWFQTAWFCYDNGWDGPLPADIYVPAYLARFQPTHGELPASDESQGQIVLCILHDPEFEFPYGSAHSNTIAFNFGIENGLELQGSVGSG